MMDSTKYYKARFIIVWHENQHKTLENGYLSVKGDKIEGYYSVLPDGSNYEDLGNVAITPGFINLHSHPSEVFALKSYREDIGNPNFYEGTLYDYALVLPFTERSAFVQAKLNIAEMLKSGCTTQLICGGGYSRVEAQIAGEMGVRAYVGAAIRAGDPKEEKSIWESPDGHSIIYNFNEEAGMDRLAEAVELVKEMRGSYDGRVNAILAPTQTMTCTPKMLKETRKWADKLGGPITIHGSEAPTEFESCIRMFGQTPVEYMKDNGMLGEDVIIAHCLYIAGHSRIYMAGNRDLKLLGESGATVAHCPWALARSGNFLQSFASYMKAGVNLGIGTDTFPSDYLLEMRCAASIGKIADRSTFAVSAKMVFDAATIGGAKALGRKDIGRLEKGAKADFVVFKLDSIEMSPVRDVVKNIVYSATRHSVKDVFVDGMRIVEDGVISGFDERSLSKELQELSEESWRNTSKYDRMGRAVDELSPLSAPTFTEGEKS